MGVLVQVLCTILVCCVCACMGITFAWPSSTIRLFESANTTLHRPMSDTELSLFGSMTSIGALIGTPAMGFMLDWLGRKNTLIFASTIGTLAWTLIACSSRVEVLLLAMFVSGLSGAVFLVVPVYISEFCQESIRGAMTSGTMVFYCVGMLVSYLLGGLLSYDVMIYVCLSMGVLVTVLLSLIKESPTYLMAKGLDEDAARSIAFYRSVKTDTKEVLEEMNVIRRSLNPEIDEITPEEETLKDLKSPAQTKQKLSLYRFIKKSKSTRRGLYLTLTLITLAIFQGLVVVQVYAEPLFVEHIACIPPITGSILLAVTAILAGFVAAYMTESPGRRPLMMHSSFATGASCLLLGLQIHLKIGPNWLVAANMYFFTAVYSLGSGTVPYVLMSEVFLPEVKSFTTMLVVEWAWLCNSIILFIFNPLLKAIGLGPVFYIFSAISILTGVYCFFMLPETKGLAVDEIQNKLYKRKRKNNGVY